MWRSPDLHCIKTSLDDYLKDRKSVKLNDIRSDIYRFMLKFWKELKEELFVTLTTRAGAVNTILLPT